MGNHWLFWVLSMARGPWNRKILSAVNAGWLGNSLCSEKFGDPASRIYLETPFDPWSPMNPIPLFLQSLPPLPCNKYNLEMSHLGALRCRWSIMSGRAESWLGIAMLGKISIIPIHQPSLPSPSKTKVPHQNLSSIF